jgi:hypothetical protein
MEGSCDAVTINQDDLAVIQSFGELADSFVLQGFTGVSKIKLTFLVNLKSDALEHCIVQRLVPTYNIIRSQKSLVLFKILLDIDRPEPPGVKQVKLIPVRLSFDVGP